MKKRPGMAYMALYWLEIRLEYNTTVVKYKYLERL